MSVDLAPLGVFLTDSKFSSEYRSALSCAGEFISNGSEARENISLTIALLSS